MSMAEPPPRASLLLHSFPRNLSVRLSPSSSHQRRNISCAAAYTSTTNTTGTAGKREPRGFTKPRPISLALQELVGVPEIPRTQAVKQIWAYIKENNLQDPDNKKIIICDEKLKKILGGKERVGFLEISGLINAHFVK